MDPQLVLSFGGTVFFLALGYALGSYLEGRHLRRLEAREAALRDMPCTTFQRLPDDWTPTRVDLVTGSVVISVDYFKRFVAGLLQLRIAPGLLVYAPVVGIPPDLTPGPGEPIEKDPSGADQEETHMVMVNWLLNEEPMTHTESLTLEILDHLLMGTTSSILRKTLMESGLGAAITGGGLSDELLQATFSVGLKGVQPGKVGDVEKLIYETLEGVAKEGFGDDAIAASMNTLEFSVSTVSFLPSCGA